MGNIDLKSLLVGILVAGVAGFLIQQIRLAQFGRRNYMRRSALVPAFRSPAEIRKAYIKAVLKAAFYLAVFVVGMAFYLTQCRS